MRWLLGEFRRFIEDADETGRTHFALDQWSQRSHTSISFRVNILISREILSSVIFNLR